MPHDTIPALYNGRRYHAYNDWAKRRHGGRIQKVSLDAGFTCPNRDGSRGTGGCTYCNNRGFTPGYLRGLNDLEQQLETGLEFVKRRYPDSIGYLAYFQAYSNTYGELSQLRQLYERALSHSDISGLAIGTRPDCLSDETLDYLAELAQKYRIELEIGIESCDDQVLNRCNRGHTFAETVDAMQRAAQRGLYVTGHLLLGLPGETRQTVQAGAKQLAKLPLNSLKFHQLQVVKGTQLAREWRQDPAQIPLLSMDDYLDWVVDVLEYLPPQTTVQRLGSEVPERMRLSEGWQLRIGDLPALLDAALERRQSWQGRQT